MAGDGGALGARIVAYAKANLGSQVGDGECYALADKALSDNSAKSAPHFAKPGENTPKNWGDADYRWGTLVDLKSVRPGDILQFRNFKSTIRTRTEKVTKTADKILTEITTSEADYSAPHHTAIVEQNLGNGEVIVLEQGESTGRIVVRSTIAVSGKNCGPLKEGMPEVTARCVISGTVKAYRAVPSAKPK